MKNTAHAQNQTVSESNLSFDKKNYYVIKFKDKSYAAPGSRDGSWSHTNPKDRSVLVFQRKEDAVYFKDVVMVGYIGYRYASIVNRRSR